MRAFRTIRLSACVLAAFFALWQAAPARFAQASGDLPSTFDLRLQGRVPPMPAVAANANCPQESPANGWAAAAMTALESSLLPAVARDYSENNLLNRHDFDIGTGACTAGNAAIAVAYLTRWAGPVLESQDPFGSPTSPALAPDRRVQNALTLPVKKLNGDNQAIKENLVAHGAVLTSMRFAPGNYNAATSAYFMPAGPGATNQMVTIVGWDDAYPAANFTNDPEEDGAFIVRSTWGTGFGQSGYFFVSYADGFLGWKDLTVFPKPTPTSAYKTIYQYDLLGQTASLSIASNTAWFGNVFAATDAEPLRAVGFFAAYPGLNYEVSVYLDPVAGGGSIPNMGQLAAKVSGNVSSAGFHTVALTSPFPLVQGRKFLVSVKVVSTGQANRNLIPLEAPIHGATNPSLNYSTKASNHAAESFYSSDGVNWTDVVGMTDVTTSGLTVKYGSSNVCVKAYAGGTPPQPDRRKFNPGVLAPLLLKK